MVNVGVVRKVDKIGRISLPIELRRTFNYGIDECVEMFLEGDYVKLVKMEKGLGIVRRVDDLGRLVIPVECRRRLYINFGDSVEIYTDDSAIYLKKYERGCVLCGDIFNVKPFKSKHICTGCVKEIKNAY